jgi:cation:H+ antiporter
MAIADEFGLTGGLVGFTLVAIGTSLPELVTAVVAARKGETELILGNLLGSNLFNSLAVGGVIALVGSGRIEDRGLATVGVIGMVLVAITAWAFMVTLRRVHRLEAVLLLSAWLASVVLMAGDSTTVADAIGL